MIDAWFFIGIFLFAIIKLCWDIYSNEKEERKEAERCRIQNLKNRGRDANGNIIDQKKLEEVMGRVQ